MTTEETIRDKALTDIARRMLIAARTAPKGKGVDNTVLALCDKEDIKKLSDHLKQMHAQGRAADYFVRDAENILTASAMLLLGTKVQTMGLSPAECVDLKTAPKKINIPRCLAPSIPVIWG